MDCFWVVLWVVAFADANDDVADVKGVAAVVDSKHACCR